MIQHRLRVREDVLFVLVVGELNPRVVLRCGEIQKLRLLACRWEPRLRSVAVRLGKIAPGVFFEDYLALVRYERNLTAYNRDADRLGAPDGAPLVGTQERKRLVTVVLYAKVAFKVGLPGERHRATEAVAQPPPLFPRQHLHGKRIRTARGSACASSENDHDDFLHCTSLAVFYHNHGSFGESERTHGSPRHINVS